MNPINTPYKSSKQKKPIQIEEYMMSYNIHINKATKPKQNIEFMQRNNYETLETLILNIASNMHLNNRKT
jgi:hypothetical protein